ncbi:MAG: hypothetical protein OXF05_02085 [Hyphomicrobiales bacterium]|nr:hypothetical protein [Hyphomicrobiales bacterium]
MVAATLPMAFLIACGGGGGGGGAASAPAPAPAPTPTIDDDSVPPDWSLLTEFAEHADFPVLEAVRGITRAMGADLFLSPFAEAGNLNETGHTKDPGVYLTTLPGGGNNLVFNIGAYEDISLAENNNFWVMDSYTSITTTGVVVGDVTLARNRLTGTRYQGMSHMEIQTFSGWLDGSVFGTSRIAFAYRTPAADYRFVSHTSGVPSNSMPRATGTETSATWEGVTVASIKADREFIRGDATITISDLTNADVNLRFDNWHDLDNEELSTMPAITYDNLTLTNGSFGGSSPDQVFGHFYGTDHNEVGGYFNTMDVTGAFGGTRQPAESSE